MAQIVLAMTQHQINHLVVTEDGSPASPVCGIVSEHDLMLMHGNHPAVLVKHMGRAETVSELARIRDRADELIYNYLEQQISVPFVAQVISEINDALVQRALVLSLAELGEPPVPFCWLALGSDGRQEQLLRTDQDNAILYADPPAAEADTVRAYFQALGAQVVAILMQCGFAPCKGDIMASNPEWVQPLSIWQGYFSNWLFKAEPEALRKISIFVDFRPVFGDETLSQAIMGHIFNVLQGNQRFLHFFVQSALQHPAPQGFFGGFLVEKTGENKNLFHLKARSLRPLDHAARVLSLAHQLQGSKNTFARYAQLAEMLPDKALFEEAAMAYDTLLRYRALTGLREANDGSYIQIQNLNSFEKQTLKTCFKTVERIQQYIQTMFGLRR